MNFVIGDVHGEYTKLKSLLTNIQALDSNASFVFIGDYLDKGEDPYRTLQFLSAFSQQHPCVFLRGNHEFYWELLQNDTDEHAQYLLKYGGKNTMHSVDKNLSVFGVKEKLFSEFETFFHSLKNFHIAGDFIMTHSGIPPEFYLTPIEEIKPKELLFNRYDFISNSALFQGKKIIFGHTGFYSPYYDGYKIGIDTAACYLETQPLTAFCTDENFFINSNNDTFQLQTINQSSCPAIPRVKAWRQL